MDRSSSGLRSGEPERQISRNPDHELIKAFLAKPQNEPLAFDVNPLAGALGARILSAESVVGSVTIAFDPGAHFVQGNGLIQGGIVSAMLDFALALAAFTRLDFERKLASASLSVNFLRPVRPGRCVATARLDRMGARIAFAGATLSAENRLEQPLATASSLMVIA